MALRQCDKCSEMVDEAKAFCPGCGHAFVEEQTRKEASSFDTMDSTVQLGQTMYNQMLSDMGLNVSEPQQMAEKRIEALVPAAIPTEKRVEVLEPVAVAVKPPERKTETPKAKSKAIWLILGGVFLVLGFFFVLLVVMFFIYWTGFR